MPPFNLFPPRPPMNPIQRGPLPPILRAPGNVSRGMLPSRGQAPMPRPLPQRAPMPPMNPLQGAIADNFDQTGMRAPGGVPHQQLPDPTMISDSFNPASHGVRAPGGAPKVTVASLRRQMAEMNLLQMLARMQKHHARHGG